MLGKLAKEQTTEDLLKLHKAGARVRFVYRHLVLSQDDTAIVSGLGTVLGPGDPAGVIRVRPDNQSVFPSQVVIHSYRDIRLLTVSERLVERWVGQDR